MSDILHERLAQRGWLLADGATGTNLFAMGLESGEAPELWNVDHPERIEAHYRSFVAAGSDLILTNSFGANRLRLKLHAAEHRVGELNEAAARLARNVADERDPPVIVAGSMGPTGEIYVPLGPLTVEAAREAYREQAEALVRGGADVLWIETISSREEMQAAVEGASETGRPVVCTLSFDTNGRTMMGLRPDEVPPFAAYLPHPPCACGSNCGVGAAETVMSILNMRRAAPPGSLLVAKGNCGVPRWVDGEIVYDGTPELMARYARLAFAAGARIIGGCCGTTPAHVSAMREALESLVDVPSVPEPEQVAAELGEISTGAREQQGGDAPGRGGGRRGRRSR